MKKYIVYKEDVDKVYIYIEEYSIFPLLLIRIRSHIDIIESMCLLIGHVYEVEDIEYVVGILESY